MDPNKAWAKLTEHLAAGDLRAACDAADGLYKWLSKGGFVPAGLPDGFSAPALTGVFLNASMVLEWAAAAAEGDEEDEG